MTKHRSKVTGEIKNTVRNVTFTCLISAKAIRRVPSLVPGTGAEDANSVLKKSQIHTIPSTRMVYLLPQIILLSLYMYIYHISTSFLECQDFTHEFLMKPWTTNFANNDDLRSH